MAPVPAPLDVLAEGPAEDPASAAAQADEVYASTLSALSSAIKSCLYVLVVGDSDLVYKTSIWIHKLR